MSAFDAKIRVAEVGIQLNRESEDELALEAEMILGVMAVAPVGPGQAIPVPLGTLRVPLDKNSVVSLGEQFTKAAEQMKEPSKLEVASSLEGVEQAAKITEGLR